MACYQSTEKRDESKTTSDADALKQENDRLKQELAESKEQGVAEFRAMYKQMLQGEKKEEGNKDEGRWQQQRGRKCKGSDAGKDGKSGGKGRGKGGNRKGRGGGGKRRGK